MIKPVRNIKPTEISDKIKPKSEEWLIARKAKLPPQAIQNYRKALNPDLPVGYRIRKFLAAETQSGRIAKVVKDAALFFVPHGSKISTLTEFVTMWLLNRLKEKSTWRGIIAVLTAVGVGLSPEQTAAIVTAGVALAGAIEVFFKEPQSKDA